MVEWFAMQILAAWYAHLSDIGSQTFRVWRRVLPKVLIAWTTGWLVHQLTMIATAPLQANHPWLVVILFSFGLVAYLAGIIIGIRIAGEPAGLWDALPASAARIGRDEPLLRVVSISLLPFVGVYSVFGGINEATYSLFIYGARQVSLANTATSILDPQTADQRLQVAAVLVVCYLLRRGLEATADRTGSTTLGLIGALVEGFFSVVLVFSGTRMLGDFVYWLRVREVWGWFNEIGSLIAGWLSAINELIPEVIGAVWRFLSGTLWPLFTDGIMAPLLWLAVAGLVFGTYTLSAAELWEQGAQSSGRLKLASQRIAAIEDRGRHASASSRKVTLEFVEIFVGDLEDRIIPFIQSLRHVVKVGLPFMAAYVLLYSVAAGLSALVLMATRAIVGGQEFEVWFYLLPFTELAGGVLGEPVRLSLLAVAMTLTLSANRERETDDANIASRAPGLVQAAAPRAQRWSRQLLAVLVTIACLLASGAINHTTDTGVGEDLKPVAPGQFGELVPGQFIAMTAVRAGHQISIDGLPQWALSTDHTFLAIDLLSESRTGRTHAIKCALFMPPRDGVGEISAILESYLVSPKVGFKVAHTVVFERPSDQLAGAKLHCQPVSLYQSYQPVLVFDLGIDAARETELGAQTGVIEFVTRPDDEVLR